LSYRDIEKMMLERGIFITYEAIRKWCRKFGQQYANQIKRRRPQPSDKWHLDEVAVTIDGQKYYLWRAVDSDGNVLDILMQTRLRHESSKQVLPQAVEETGLCTASHRNRQAQELWGSQKRDFTRSGASTAQGIE
jgi:putative transposase